MRFRTLAWKGNALEIIDQTKLPAAKVYLRCRSLVEVWKMIRTMKIRGAPAIGVAAAFGLYLGIRTSKARRYEDFAAEFVRASEKIRSARPTARNLFAAVERMEAVVRENPGKSPGDLKKLLLRKALEIQEEDRRLCEAIGRYGVPLLEKGDSVLTHCNAGALATAGAGTALAVIYEARRRGKKVDVVATETRPFLQGARLTAWELKENGIPVTLVCDSVVGTLMKSGRVSKVMVGADRIAANGDVANKIGTYAIACLAKKHQIPLYVAAPSTTFDFSLKSGAEIPIEMRDGTELAAGFAKPVVPRGVRVLNPAFDVTPHDLVSGMVTEKGIFYPPFRRSLARLKKSVAGAQRRLEEKSPRPSAVLVKS